MKIFILVALLACVLAANGASFGLGRNIECLKQARQTRIGEGTIRDIIEDIRAQLKNGFDPLKVEDKQVNVKNDILSLNAIISADSQGLAGFEIDKVSLSLIGLKLKLILRWPEITARGQYDGNLNSTLFPTNYVGKGGFDLIIKNFIINAEAKISVSLIGSKIHVKTLIADLKMDAFDLEISGVMHDEELSANISKHLSENVPQWLQEYKDKINELIANNLDIINDIISGNKLFTDEETSSLRAYQIACGYEY